MKTLTVRNLEDEMFDEFAARARQQQRNPEAHARFLIEREASGAAETCGELLDWIESQPAPEVEIAAIDAFQAGRGRRSNRP